MLLHMSWTTEECEFESQRGVGDVLFPVASGPALGSVLSPVQWALGVV
jgi:hypothetical protein